MDTLLTAPYQAIASIHCSFQDQLAYIEFSLSDPEQVSINEKSILKTLETDSDKPRILCNELDLHDRFYLEHRLEEILRKNGNRKVS